MASVEEARASAGPLPDYLHFNPERYEGVLIRRPDREEIPEQVNENLVEESYSR